MARKPNYDFEKRRKEQERKAKKDAKAEERRRRREAGEPEPDTLDDLLDRPPSDADADEETTPPPA